MSSNVISLKEYRQLRKKLFMERHQTRVENFITSFISQNFKMNFDMINQQYLAHKAYQNEMAWDYQDFREELKDAVRQVFGDQIWAEVRALYWFDPQWISRDELIELCISYFILGKTKAANG